MIKAIRRFKLKIIQRLIFKFEKNTPNKIQQDAIIMLRLEEMKTLEKLYNLEKIFNDK